MMEIIEIIVHIIVAVFFIGTLAMIEIVGLSGILIDEEEKWEEIMREKWKNRKVKKGEKRKEMTLREMARRVDIINSANSIKKALSKESEALKDIKIVEARTAPRIEPYDPYDVEKKE